MLTNSGKIFLAVLTCKVISKPCKSSQETSTNLIYNVKSVKSSSCDSFPENQFAEICQSNVTRVLTSS